MQRSFLSHAAIYGVATLLVQAAGFLLLPLYTRCLGPTQYGTLEIVTRLAETASTLLLIGGFRQALFVLHNQAVDEAERRRIACAAYLLLGASCLVGGGLLLAAAPWLAGFLSGETPLDPWTLRLGIVTVLLEPFSLLPLCLLQARVQSLAYVLVVLGQLIVRVGLGVVLVAGFGWGATGALGAVAITGLLFGVMLSVLELRRGMAWPTWANARDLVAFALPMVPGGACFFVLHHGDRFFLLRNVSIDEVGIYGLGYRLGMMAALFGFTPLHMVWSARMYEAARQPDAAQAFGVVFTRCAAAFAVAGLALSLFASEAVALLAGPAYAAAASVVPLVVLACGFQSASTLLDAGLFVTRRSELKLVATGAATALMVGLYACLIPLHGTWGAAWATVGGFAFLSLATLFLSQRQFHVAYEPGRLAGLAALVACIALVAAVQPWGMAGKVVLCAAAPLAMMAALASEEEKAMLRAALARPIRPKGSPAIAGGDIR